MMSKHWLRASLSVALISATAADVAAAHAAWLAEPAWIIDGFGGMDLIARRFAAADTIIFVDFPLYTHYWWALKRQARTIGVCGDRR